MSDGRAAMETVVDCETVWNGATGGTTVVVVCDAIWFVVWGMIVGDIATVGLSLNSHFTPQSNKSRKE